MPHRVEQGTGTSVLGGRRNDRADNDLLQSSYEAGFTLVEMLVVLVLAAVMAAMMVSGIRQMQTWTQLEKRQSAQSALESVADHISDELSGALPLPLLERGNDKFTPMVGAADSIRFVAVIRTGFSAKALRETSYAVEPSSEGKTLVRKSKPHRFPQQGEALQVQSEEVYEGVTGLKLAYLVRPGNNSMTWLEKWANQPKLPVAVRITIFQIVDRYELSASRTISLGN